MCSPLDHGLGLGVRSGSRDPAGPWFNAGVSRMARVGPKPQLFDGLDHEERTMGANRSLARDLRDATNTMRILCPSRWLLRSLIIGK